MQQTVKIRSMSPEEGDQSKTILEADRVTMSESCLAALTLSICESTKLKILEIKITKLQLLALFSADNSIEPNSC